MTEKEEKFKAWMEGDVTLTMKRKEFLTLHQAATVLAREPVDAEELANLEAAVIQIENLLDLPYKDDR